MWPVIGGAIAGLGSLVSGWFSSDTSAQNTQANIAMQQQTNQMNIAENQKNRDFQQQMSSTAYQRASTDMQAAGLNPAMMFGSGSAASTPSGGVPRIDAPRSEKTSPMQGLGAATEKIASTAITSKVFDKLTEEIANIRADTAKREAEVVTEKERPAQIREQTFLTANESARLQNLMPTFRIAGVTAEDIEAMNPTVRRILVQAGFGGEKLGHAADVLSSMVSSASGVRRLLQYPDNPTRKYHGFEDRWP